MKPIDIIKNRLDTDIMEHQQFCLCEILDSKSVTGVGIIVKVRPLREKVGNWQDVGAGEFDGQPPAYNTIETYSAVCINQPRMHLPIKWQFNALLFSIQRDGAPSLAFLVPKTFVDPFDAEIDQESKDRFTSRRGDMVQEK